MSTARCGICGGAVLWTITEAGKRLAVDAEPDPAGNTAAYRDGTGGWRSRRPSAELPLMGWERLYMPHAATCRSARPGPEALRCAGVISLAERRLKRRRNGGRR